MICFFLVVQKLLVAFVDGVLDTLERLGVTGWVFFWLLCSILYRKNIAGLISHLQGVMQRLRKITVKGTTALLRDDRSAHDRGLKQNTENASLTVLPTTANVTSTPGEEGPTQVPKQASSAGSSLSPYECYWLGHDLAWTQMVLLSMGTATDINYGLRQSLSHLSTVVNEDRTLYSNLQSILESCSSYGDADWTEDVRVSVFNQLGVLKNEVGGLVFRRQMQIHQ